MSLIKWLLSQDIKSFLFVCPLVHVCACVLKLCMCVLILVAATRSYSRSTGALHTPDTFGAAGEGWVLTFVCTSPTHHFAFNYFFICSLLCIASSPIIYQHVSVPCFFFIIIIPAFCSRKSSSGNAWFHPFSCNKQPFCQFYHFSFLFSSAPCQWEHQRVLLSLMPYFVLSGT